MREAARCQRIVRAPGKESSPGAIGRRHDRSRMVAFFAAAGDVNSSMRQSRELAAEGRYWEAVKMAGVRRGPRGNEQVYRTFFHLLQHRDLEQEQLVIDGDKAAMLLHIHGTDTHRGNHGIASTDGPLQHAAGLAVRVEEQLWPRGASPC